MLKLFLLGYPRVVFNDAPVEDFISNKVLLLVCYLALNRRTHAREALATLLWGDMPEDRAKSNLRQALHNMQKRIPDTFEVTRQSVAFKPEAEVWVDVDALHEDIDLYKGDFLDGVQVDDAPELEDWLRVQREQARLQFITALDHLADQHNETGEWAQAEHYTRLLLNVEPWREASHRQLMMLLARQGKFSAALAQYETCNHILEKELGVPPMPETTALYERIQRARETPRDNLPPQPGTFVGREQELGTLSGWLRDPHCRLITLLGPGGVGKSRLAQELAHQHTSTFLNGVRYVSLAPLTRPDFIVTSIGQALNLSFSNSASPQQQLMDALQQQELLLLLDNFEHLMGGVEVIGAILQHAPAVKLVVTSRERLDFQEEWVFTLDGLTPTESVQYFVQSAQQRRRDFTLQGQEQAVDALCRLLDGLPLGIELATALLSVLSAAQIITEIEQNLDVLATNWRNIPARHRSLRAVFDHSWRLLDDRQQHVFARLAVFRGGFTLEAARQVAGADLLTLNELIAKSLVRMTDARYDIHEMLRQYAYEMLSDPDDHITTHMGHYATILAARLPEFRTADADALLADIDADLDNVRLAWQTAVERADFPAIAQMMAALHSYYEARNLFQEGVDVFNYAQAHLQPADDDSRFTWGKLLAHNAGLHARIGAVPEAHALASESVTVLRTFDDSADLAFALNVLGIMALYRGKFDTAIEHLQASAEIYRQLDHFEGLQRPLANLGGVYTRTGRYQEAIAAMDEGLTISRRQDNRRGMAHFLVNLGSTHQTTGDHATAKACYAEAIPISEALGSLYIKGVALLNLAEIHYHEGDYGAAITTAGESVAALETIHDRRNQTYALLWLALAHHENGDDARPYLRQGLNNALETQAAPLALVMLFGVGMYWLGSERNTEALDLLQAVAEHPATEHDYRRQATAALAERDITPGDPTERPVFALASRLLEEMTGQL